jgi:hypothetical protein
MADSVDRDELRQCRSEFIRVDSRAGGRYLLGLTELITIEDA